VLSGTLVFNLLRRVNIHHEEQEFMEVSQSHFECMNRKQEIIKDFHAMSNRLCFTIAAMLFITLLTSCEKNFDIKVSSNTPKLVVEAYINNEMRAYNYVILSRSVDYLSSNIESTPVTDATVTITEGERAGDGYNWDIAKKVQLQSLNIPGIPNELANIYFDPRLLVDSSTALIGKPGKSYLLEISEGGNQYTAITTLLPPVPIDSLTTGYGYTDVDDSSKYKLRITNNYQDPDTLGNTQLYFYRSYKDGLRFGWGSFGGNRNNNFGTDELTNGQYIRLTHPRGFVVGDTVEYHMASVTRDIYNFWVTFNDARNNGGPFATPVTLATNITGSDVTGCFCGFSLSSRVVVVR
jgi:hypothetical protein